MQVQAQYMHVLTCKNPNDIDRYADCDPPIFGFATFMTWSVLYCKACHGCIDVFLGRTNTNSTNM